MNAEPEGGATARILPKCVEPPDGEPAARTGCIRVSQGGCGHAWQESYLRPRRSAAKTAASSGGRSNIQPTA